MKNFFVNLFDLGTTVTKWSFTTFRITDFLDILVVAFIIYEILIWVRKTKAWVLFKGIAVILAFWGAAAILSLNMAVWVFEKTLSVGILAVIIIFQPELRRALEQLGRGKFFKNLPIFNDEEKLTESTAQAMASAMHQMSLVKTGALIVVEQKTPLHEYEQTGISIDAKVSSQLLVNIFEHNTPLHDGAVIIRENRIQAATCYLPLSENSAISKELGTRHRAAMGISEVTDCKVFVVSEETGRISMAYGGQLYRDIDEEFIRRELIGDLASNKNKNRKLREKILKRKEQ